MSLHGRPTAAELVEAVREFLEADVLPATAGRVQFHTRVAVNVLGMVERELEAGDEVGAAYRRELARLGVDDEAELAAAIRSGAWDSRAGDVAAALRNIVRARLEVANPRHLEGPRPPTEHDDEGGRR